MHKTASVWISWKTLGLGNIPLDYSPKGPLSSLALVNLVHVLQSLSWRRCYSHDVQIRFKVEIPLTVSLNAVIRGMNQGENYVRIF
jgi:hypothetical protein